MLLHAAEIREALMASIPLDVRSVMRTLISQGHRVWIVGGAIRDACLGLSPKDWDLATSAHPAQVMALFPHALPIGIRYGTIQVRTSERAIEVTSIDDESGDGITRDLTRRDFTVNAMAMAYPDGRLLDPYGGWTDLESCILRGVRDAAARFTEDPLRTLRAGRLVSVYGLHLEERTCKALAETSRRLSSVAPERIREEVYRLLTGDHVSEGLIAMRSGGVWEAVLPEINDDRIFQHAAATTGHCRPRLRLRLAALLHGIGQTVGSYDGAAWNRPCSTAARRSAELAAGILERWRASHRQVRELTLILEHQLPTSAARWTDADLRRWVAGAGPELLEDILELAHAERLACCGSGFPDSKGGWTALEALESLQLRIFRLLRQNPPLTIRQLAVTGGDVMRLLQLDPGPLVGRLLRRLHDLVLEDPECNTVESLSEILKREYSHLKQHGDPQ